MAELLAVVIQLAVLHWWLGWAGLDTQRGFTHMSSASELLQWPPSLHVSSLGFLIAWRPQCGGTSYIRLTFDIDCASLGGRSCRLFF